MRVLFILLRFLLFYLLFRLFLRGIFVFMESFRNQPKTYQGSHRKTTKNAFDDKDVVNGEFEEIK